MNASGESIAFTFQSFARQPRWETVLETFDDRRIGELRNGGALSTGGSFSGYHAPAQPRRGSEAVMTPRTDPSRRPVSEPHGKVLLPCS
jgi:hypothetical protein